MIPRVLFILLIASALSYFGVWVMKHEDRALVRTVIYRALVALLIGAVVTFGIINIDVLTN